MSFTAKVGAFTLIELLVIVAIIAILASLLLPALSRSKMRAQAIMDLSSKKQMSLAWTMYSGDNSDRLAYNLPPDTSMMMFAPAINANWVNNVMNWELTPGNTNLDFVNQSILAPYVNYSPAVFHCPSDYSLSAIQRNAGWKYRVRSISMNALVGDPGNLSYAPSSQSALSKQLMKEGDFRDPSSIFVFLDEHPDSIDDGYFVVSTNNTEWVDLPASYHNGGGSFSFADGHAEIHRWQNTATIRPPLPDAAKLPTQLTPDTRADFDWVVRHASNAKP